MGTENSIIIVDGTPGSGRTTATNQLATAGGFTPVRFDSPVPEVYRALSNGLDYHNAIRNGRERDKAFHGLMNASLRQLDEAVKLRNEGHTPILDGSMMSLLSSVHLGHVVAHRLGSQYLEQWMLESEEKARQALLEHSALEHVRCMVITLKRHRWTRDNPRLGITGLEEQEVRAIAETADDIAEIRGIQVIALDFDEGDPLIPYSFRLYTGSYPTPASNQVLGLIRSAK